MQEYGLLWQVDDERWSGGGHRYRVWAKLGVDEMMRRGRGRGRDRRFGSAWWWRRRRRRRVWDWDGMGQITSGRLVSSRPESSRVGVGAGVGVHEGGGSRAASAESRIENRNRSRCLVWSCLASPCLSLPLRAGPVISPARVPMCERAGGWTSKDLLPSKHTTKKSRLSLVCPFIFPYFAPRSLAFCLGCRDVLSARQHAQQRRASANSDYRIPTTRTTAGWANELG